MYDLDILESSLFEDDDDMYYMNEAVSADKAKLLAMIAAGVALGVLLITIIRKVRKKRADQKIKDEQNAILKDRSKVTGKEKELNYCDEMMKEINDHVDNLKEAKKDVKNQIQGLKNTQKKINREISGIKKFIGPVTRMAKMASVPYDKIAKLSNAIQDRIQATPKYKSESVDEYYGEIEDFFESVMDFSEDYYRKKDSSFNINLDDILD